MRTWTFFSSAPFYHLPHAVPLCYQVPKRWNESRVPLSLANRTPHMLLPQGMLYLFELQT